MTEPDHAQDTHEHDIQSQDTGSQDTGSQDDLSPAEPDEGSDGGAPTVGTTGVAAADEAAQRLAEVEDAPVEAHVGIYEDVHRRLQEGLADLDEQ